MTGEPIGERRLSMIRTATRSVWLYHALEKLSPEQAEERLELLREVEEDPKALALAEVAIRRRAAGDDDTAQREKLRRYGERLERRAWRARSSAVLVLLEGGRKWR